MPCCRGQDYDKVFDAKTARRELRRLARKGPSGATRHLLDALRPHVRNDYAVLDIGGGVGALQHELSRVADGAIVAVDASSAYLAVAQGRAEALGYAARRTAFEGDFVQIANTVPSADVVLLDKVICCYPDMPALVGASATKCRALYGIVVPRDGPLVRAASGLGNWLLRLLGRKFRSFIHRLGDIHAHIERAGLRLQTERRGWLWVVRVYARSPAPS